MKKALSCAALAMCGLLFLHTAISVARSSRDTEMSLRVLAKSGPHVISFKHELVTFYFTIRGMVVHAKYPSKNIRGEGHVQMYLDKIPSKAYRVKDLANIVSYSAPQKVRGGKHEYAISIQFDNGWVKEYKGSTHKLKIGLARNNMVMYRVQTATFKLEIK